MTGFRRSSPGRSLDVALPERVHRNRALPGAQDCHVKLFQAVGSGQYFKPH